MNLRRLAIPVVTAIAIGIGSKVATGEMKW
jgi:hypothetical protein